MMLRCNPSQMLFSRRTATAKKPDAAECRKSPLQTQVSHVISCRSNQMQIRIGRRQAEGGQKKKKGKALLLLTGRQLVNGTYRAAIITTFGPKGCKSGFVTY